RCVLRHRLRAPALVGSGRRALEGELGAGARSARGRMNPGLQRLSAYPFEKLARLKAGVVPPGELAHISMSIGEPQHAPPELILKALRAGVEQLGGYPPTIGRLELREAAA